MGLRKRVCELENQVKELQQKTTIEILIGEACANDYLNVSVEKVVVSMISHLGLELKSVPGREASIEFKRKKK